MKREALLLAENGLKVFPITPARKAPPLVKGFSSVATDDPSRVEEFWSKHPQANIGVSPGGGTIIIDTDSPAAERFIADLELPETTTVSTPRGGRHRYFLGSAPSRAGVRPGIDVRGRGGYAVAPGSVVGGDTYKWIVPPWDVSPRPAPSAVTELVAERAKRQAFDTSAIPEGRRNTSLVQIAGWFVGHGVRGEPLALSLHTVNRQRCKPPLHEQEVEKIVKSANKWDHPPLWIVDPLGFVQDPRLDMKAHALLTALALRARHDGTVIGGAWLAESTGMHRNSVGAAAAELQRLGRIHIQPPEKRGHANVYRLLEIPGHTAYTHIGSTGAQEMCTGLRSAA